MKFLVLKTFAWGGLEQMPGEVVEIAEDDRHLYGLQKARFVRFDGNAPPRKVRGLPEVEESPLPTVEEVTSEISHNVPSGQRQDPREVVAAAKARAIVR